MSHEFHTLKLRDIIIETPDSKSLVFDVPTILKSKYTFKSGQYLTLSFDINGVEFRRPYSICSAPHEEKLIVNVKKLKNGKVSSFIHEKLSVGDSVKVMQPDGNFILNPQDNLQRDHYFFASGSGITPILSMIKSVVENEPKSRCYLCYGNRDEDSIIFKDDLSSLEKKFAGQLFIKHTLTKPKKNRESGLKGFFSKSKIDWEGWTGRINDEKINSFILEYPNRSTSPQFYVCGPGTMIDDIIVSLKKSEIPESNIHTEVFLAAKDVSVSTSETLSSEGALVKVHLHGKEIELIVPSNKTILEALISQKYDPPYSCTSGACSTCVAKILDGKVAMDVCYALDDNEVKAGYILTCQSRVKSPSAEIRYEG